MIHYKLLAEDQLFHLYQWHKSLGVVLLFSIVLRVVWRLSHRPPALPATSLSTTETFSRQQLLAAKAGHIALYSLLLLMPLSGWLLVSSSEVRIPTLVFSVLQWPHLPLADDWNVTLINYLASSLHYYGAIILALLIVGHIAMVFKHRQHGINLLERMPFNKAAIAAVTCFVISLAILSALSLSGQTSNAKEQGSQQQLNSRQGEIQFAGVHTGNRFEGIVEQWALQTQFDPTTQQLTAFQLNVEANSIKTGNNYYDASLAESDWFDSAQHPQIIFKSDTITETADNTFDITGTLTIKQQTKTLNFVVTLDKTRLATQFSLSRLTHGLGVDSDPDAEWVDEMIEVSAWAELSDKNH